MPERISSDRLRPAPRMLQIPAPVISQNNTQVISQSGMRPEERRPERDKVGMTSNDSMRSVRSPGAESGEVDTHEYVIDALVDHKQDSDNDCVLFRVRWYGYASSQDTWEPAHALPAGLVARYCRANKIAMPRVNY